MAATATNFGDLLDPRFRRIYEEHYNQLPDMINKFYRVETAKLATERVSSVGTLSDTPQFLGSVTYDDVYQGYDTTITVLEFAQGFQVERKLFEFDQFSIMDRKPKALANSLNRRRQTDAARQFNNAFSVDTFFYVNSEGVALCSNSHTTTASGTSTTTGFDNLVTTSLTAVALESAWIDFVQFRGDRGERIDNKPNMLIIPVNLRGRAEEIVGSSGKPDTANNDLNWQKDMYEIVWWNYLTDTNNWWIADSGQMKDNGLTWYEKIKNEFAQVEDFDTLVSKWRTYAIHGNCWENWRWCLGANVS